VTCSIVAVDSKTGQAGFAIASCCWDAGQVCLAVPGKGAIASQANGNVRFLRQFAEMQAAGTPLDAVLARFRETDPEIESRQVGMVSLAGESLVHTGRQCSYWAGHRTGVGYACQGNTLVGAVVIDAMADAFERADGELHERLYHALKAADDAGGDARGRQSARLMVARSRPDNVAGVAAPPVIDICVEDHGRPVAEIGRILTVRSTLMRILRHLQACAEAPPEDQPAILAELRRFLDDKREPKHLDWWESLAQAHLAAGQRDQALDAYRVYLAINPRMAAILRENAAAGTFAADVARELGLVP
jgi:uncharacterized Ntn-hydrolase superfamily protein